MGQYSLFRQSKKKTTALYTFGLYITLVSFFLVIIAGPVTTGIVNASDGKTVNNWKQIGYISLYEGDYEKAIENFKRADQVGSLNSTLLTNMSLAYWLKGDHDNAFATMDRILEKKSDPIAFYHLAYFYHLKGNKDQASDYFKKAQSLAPNILQRYDPSILIPSPTRIFYQGELDTAKIYIGAEKTFNPVTEQKRYPEIKITNLSLKPTPVAVNKPFDIRVKFKADIPGSNKDNLPILFYFKISQNNEVLYEEKPKTIRAGNAKTESWVEHMNPVPAKGIYTINAYIKYKELLAEKSIELVIN